MHSRVIIQLHQLIGNMFDKKINPLCQINRNYQQKNSEYHSSKWSVDSPDCTRAASEILICDCQTHFNKFQLKVV